MSVPSRGKIAPRDESQLGRESPGPADADSGVSPQKKKGETLKDILRSDPPWEQEKSERTGHVPLRKIASPAAVPVLGLPISSPAISERSPPRLSPRIETGSPRNIRSETAELADFLKNTPPPPANDALRRGSLNEVGAAESPSRLKSLVNRVTGKQGDRTSFSSAHDPPSLGRRISAAPLGKPQRTASANSAAIDNANRPPLQGLFSSRDRHIVDEYIGPSTLNAQRSLRDLGARPLVEVGSVASEDASLASRSLSSPTSVDPTFYSPVNTASLPEDSATRAGKQTEDPHERTHAYGGLGASRAIVVQDIVRLKRDMQHEQDADGCRRLVDELLRRHGVA